ncbi:MAG: hypothetical protein ACE15B_10165 [Bryobacteraceae bacterium]
MNTYDQTLVLGAVRVPRALFPWRSALSALGNRYCRLFHNSLSLPVNHKTRCWKCLREFHVSW